MAPPNIPAAKRAGLRVDVARLARDGDGWLTPEDRYALKTWGVCTQAQPGVFMIRVRVPGGRLQPDQLRGLAALADRHGWGWLHLTTRQNVELHHVVARDVPAVLDGVVGLGLSTRSACGHTLRNVMSCPDAGVGLDEPFDCYPDARLVSDAILARSATLNCELPSRVNVTFGGCPDCAAHARLNDAGFESVVVDGVAGYRLWAGGSLGTMPRLAVQLSPFVPRSHVLAAAEALVDVFCRHGDVDDPKRGRMKFVVDRLGANGFRAAFSSAFDVARERVVAVPPPVPVLDATALAAVLACAPVDGWSTGVRPQRSPGLATVTVRVPLGDLDGHEARGLADLAADGPLWLTRNQNVARRDVRVAAVPALRSSLDALGLGVDGADSASDVRACTGSAVCSLAIAAAPDVGHRLVSTGALARNAGLRVHVSGCPNSCAQHQAGDIGLSGAKVRVGGRTVVGYHVWLGADAAGGVLGRALGRVADEDVPAVVDAVVGAWESLRRNGETLSATVARIGDDAFAAHLGALTDRFTPGVDDAVPIAVPA